MRIHIFPLGKEKGGDNMKNITKNIVAGAMTLALAAPMAVFADTTINRDAIFGGTFGSADLPTIISSIITTIMAILGVIAVLIFLWGGFIWMTAAGDDDKVKKAKDMIISSIIGLAIIFTSWAIANFVIGSLSSATSGTPIQ
jgi:uncharacterized membrane protein